MLVADRLIYATAVGKAVALVTKDARLRDYPPARRHGEVSVVMLA